MARSTDRLMNKLLRGRHIKIIKQWIQEHFVEKITGKGLSSNDFTDEYKNKVEEIANTATDEDVDEMITEVFGEEAEPSEEDESIGIGGGMDEE